ncbi:MAG: hypothetical protein J0I84_18300 [Terrimonas sp.]|nr:hypothetical protein [Terrimonas sp.]OJY98258.1 MAG: hypothetical protein BGP13_11480 [Sphingobacteriales bacterium 40-81]
MDIATIKTGDIFYYDSYTAHDDKIHHHKCRVLFVGSESIFYDAWWEGINKWTFVPVRKRLAYYRFPMTILHRLTNLTFNGFEPIDENSANKLFLNSPEILLTTTKDTISKSESDETSIEVNSNSIVFIPIGPKGGTLKPVLLDSTQMTKVSLIKKVLEHQNLDFIHADNIILHRVGLDGGVPSYCIGTV